MDKQKIPLKKNDILCASFKDLSHEGSGVAKVEGYTLFVPGVLPGELAKIKVLKTKKNYGYGKLLELREPSPNRVQPLCPIFDQCGGCGLQHLTYTSQLQQKRKSVKESLARIGGLTNVPIHPVLGMDKPWHYRNKVQVPIGEQEGELTAGFYRRGSHHIVPMDECLIQNETNDRVVQIVKRICDDYGVQAYYEKEHQGTLRHIIVRYGQNTGELMVVIVTKDINLPSRKAIVRAITNAIPNVKSIVQNINTRRTNAIFGEETRVLWGRDVIYDTIGHVKFAISAQSFYQVNPVQTKVLYDKTLEYAGLDGTQTVIDAYCGIGTISLFLAQQARHVYGVEVVPEAIEDAHRNAKLNHLRNVTFAVGKAEEVIPDWCEQGIKANVIVVDPPRKGCDEALLQTIVEIQPKRVVYVSCNPATLARDLRILEDSGFQTREVQPVDMFPQTMHVECVTYLSSEREQYETKYNQDKNMITEREI